MKHNLLANTREIYNFTKDGKETRLILEYNNEGCFLVRTFGYNPFPFFVKKIPTSRVVLLEWMRSQGFTRILEGRTIIHNYIEKDY